MCGVNPRLTLSQQVYSSLNKKTDRGSGGFGHSGIK